MPFVSAAARATSSARASLEPTHAQSPRALGSALGRLRAACQAPCRFTELSSSSSSCRHSVARGAALVARSGAGGDAPKADLPFASNMEKLFGRRKNHHVVPREEHEIRRRQRDVKEIAEVRVGGTGARRPTTVAWGRWLSR